MKEKRKRESYDVTKGVSGWKRKKQVEGYAKPRTEELFVPPQGNSKTYVIRRGVNPKDRETEVKIVSSYESTQRFIWLQWVAEAYSRPNTRVNIRSF